MASRKQPAKRGPKPELFRIDMAKEDALRIALNVPLSRKAPRTTSKKSVHKKLTKTRPNP